MALTQTKDTSYIHLAVTTAYPVGNRRSRDLVQLKLVAGKDFEAAAQHNEARLLREFRDFVGPQMAARFDSMPDPFAPKS